MGLKLLHISDIHFVKKNGFDLDDDLRNEIERDLTSLLSEFGNIDAVLVGGDVAYSASREEYEKAYNWLKGICKTVNCLEENVLTIPGNHDVERRKICAILNETHAGFKKLRKRTDIDNKLGKVLEEKESYATLLKPFENYEAFAQRYGAIPERQSPLFWEKDFQLNGAKLRIRGINSAYISNKDDDEHTSKLMVGSHQSNLKRQDGIIYCVLCHHPPEWLYDGEDMETDFLTRAKLHLYGHKHKVKVIKQNQSLKLAAGAMHPSRTEQEWEPRYNIIDLQIIQKESKNYLEVKLWKRVWSKGDTCFISDFGKTGKEFEIYELELERTELEPIAGKAITEISVSEKPIVKPEQNDVELIATSTTNPIRKLMFMFFSLPYHKKIKVAVNLGLIEDVDMDLNEVEKSQTYFDRAHKNNKLYDLWRFVCEESEDEVTLDNPFEK